MSFVSEVVEPLADVFPEHIVRKNGRPWGIMYIERNHVWRLSCFFCQVPFVLPCPSFCRAHRFAIRIHFTERSSFRRVLFESFCCTRRFERFVSPSATGGVGTVNFLLLLPKGVGMGFPQQTFRPRPRKPASTYSQVVPRMARTAEGAVEGTAPSVCTRSRSNQPSKSDSCPMEIAIPAYVARLTPSAR